MFCNDCGTDFYSLAAKECYVCTNCGTVLSDTVFANEINPFFGSDNTEKEDTRNEKECLEITCEIMEKLFLSSNNRVTAKLILKNKKHIRGYTAEEWGVTITYLILEKEQESPQYSLQELSGRFGVNCSHTWKLYELNKSFEHQREEKKNITLRLNFLPLIRKYLYNLNVLPKGLTMVKLEKEVDKICHQLYKILFAQPLSTITATTLYILCKKHKSLCSAKMTLKYINRVTLVSPSSIKRSIKKITAHRMMLQINWIE